MASQFTTENLKRVFAFPFEDDEWSAKLMIWVLLSFGSILIVPVLFVTGYQYEIMRRIIVDRTGPSLPEWDDWGRLLKNGARYWGVSLVYLLPTFLVLGVPFFVAMMFLESGGAFENSDFIFIFLPIFLLWSVVGTAFFVLFVWPPLWQPGI